MKKQKEIIVVGHKNPDTDSICSAIAYAHLKHKLTGENYVPKRAGEINKETAFVLDYFKAKHPEYIADVRTQVCDMEIRPVPSVHKTMSIKQAYSLMRDSEASTLCITGKDGHLEGVITITDIAASDMDVYDNRIVSKAKTPYENIVRTLDARVITGDISGCFDKGRVTIAANTPERMVDFVDKDDIVVIGNRFESQFFAIEVGAACIVLCTDSEVNSTILDLAKQKGCIILSSPYDSYTVARLLNQSMPIEYFMTSKNILSFQPDDFTDEVKEVMSKERHRNFPVLDEEGRYLGQISKSSFLATKKKQMILVDHNEKNQAVGGIDFAEILEIIDHHRLGGLESINPVLFRNQPVGCTGTIVYQIYRETNTPIEKQIAGLLCSAILSDTLMFRSPTCTPVDKQAAEELAAIAEIDIPDYAQKMFEAGSNLSSRSIEDLFYQDFKTFNASGISFGVGQITSVNKTGLENLKEDMLAYMKNKYEKDSSAMLFFMLTNIIEESTILLCYGANSKEIMQTAYHAEPNEHSVLVPGMVSRKKQLVPTLIATIQQ